MNKNIKSIIIYVIAITLVIIGSVSIAAYKDRLLSKTIENTINEYFEETNAHISSHNFDISNIKIMCRGDDAYIVEFQLILDDSNDTKFNSLGATIYKDKDTWSVKGLGSGLTNDELELYNFKCYN